jgi:ubiquitin-activating enzyme E1
MGKLIKMKVLICGMRGLGIECAKDLVLAGPGAVTVYDPNICEESDLGLNFFLTPQDVSMKRTRGGASAEQLQKLNRLVDVKDVPQLSEDLVAKHTCMVVTRMSEVEAEKWNEFCRSRGVGFIRSDIFGAMGYAFVDFGDSHIIRDMNGEQPLTRIVHHVTNESEALVELVPPPDGRRHNLEESDHDGFVSFEEIEGMGPEINNGSYKAKHVYKERYDAKSNTKKKMFDAYSFRINLDTTNMGKYVSGGRMTQVKKPISVKYTSLKESLTSTGELLFTDGAKFGRAEQLHIALRALWEYETQNKGKLPSTKEDAKQVLGIAKSIDANLCDEIVTLHLCYGCTMEFQPLSAFFGGVIAQEVVKLTGKFTPLKQWLHLDAFEVLPDPKQPQELFPIPSKPHRRQDLIRLLGEDTCTKLTKSNTFLVGCGALGCEFLKNFAMLGVACGGGGLITVTDNDRIEVSNLSRQFLFREENVGQPKSVAATNAARIMNPELNVRALEVLVAPQTESTFDDGFWQSLDFVTNALDNVKARLYVDEKCVFYEKPLLESGTLGTKCNVQIAIPFKTQSYADGPKDQEDGDAIPMCTLRNFPSQIEHCIEWGRAQFADLFVSSAQEAVNYSRDPVNWVKTMRSKTLELKNASKGQLASAIEKERGPVLAVVKLAKLASNTKQTNDDAFNQCVQEAYILFHRMFRDKPVSLINSYPENTVDSKGRPFWSETKRFPRAVNTFDPKDENQMSFIISTANLIAVNRGLRAPDDFVPNNYSWRSKAFFEAIISKLPVPELLVESVDMSGGGEDEEEKRKSMLTAEQKERDEEMKMANIIKEFTDALQELEQLSTQFANGNTKKIEAVEFEKDQDANFHIDFITASSNMRAWNYRLKLASRHQVKMIAGKIIPALATTTASVCGLVGIELVKIIQDKPLDMFKDSSNSLGINGYFFSEPMPPAKAKNEFDPIELSEVICYPAGFTKWDKIRVKCANNDPTLQEFINAFSDATNGLKLNSLSHRNANVKGAQGFSSFVYDSNAYLPEDKKKYEERLSKSLKPLLVEIYGDEACGTANRTFIYLETGQNDADGNVIKVPTVVWML